MKRKNVILGALLCILLIVLPNTISSGGNDWDKKFNVLSPKPSEIFFIGEINGKNKKEPIVISIKLDTEDFDEFICYYSFEGEENCLNPEKPNFTGECMNYTMDTKYITFILKERLKEEKLKEIYQTPIPVTILEVEFNIYDKNKKCYDFAGKIKEGSYFEFKVLDQKSSNFIDSVQCFITNKSTEKTLRKDFKTQEEDGAYRLENIDSFFEKEDKFKIIVIDIDKKYHYIGEEGFRKDTSFKMTTAAPTTAAPTTAAPTTAAPTTAAPTTAAPTGPLAFSGMLGIFFVILVVIAVAVFSIILKSRHKKPEEDIDKIEHYKALSDGYAQRIKDLEQKNRDLDQENLNLKNKKYESDRKIEKLESSGLEIKRKLNVKEDVITSMDQKIENLEYDNENLRETLGRTETELTKQRRKVGVISENIDKFKDLSGSIMILTEKLKEKLDGTSEEITGILGQYLKDITTRDLSAAVSGLKYNISELNQKIERESVENTLLRDTEELLTDVKKEIDDAKVNLDTRIPEEFLTKAEKLINQGKVSQPEKAYYSFMAARILLETLKEMMNNIEILNILKEIAERG